MIAAAAILYFSESFISQPYIALQLWNFTETPPATTDRGPNDKKIVTGSKFKMAAAAIFKSVKWQ